MGMFDEIGKLTYYVDIAMLIDATGSMSPIIGKVKENAMAFCRKFHEAMESNGKNVEQLRVKVIPFRDYEFDGAMAMDDSGFFNLPEQQDDLNTFIESVKAMGSGSELNSGLEALALAMRSDWTRDGYRRRHIIVVFSDASAHKLQDSKATASKYYPENMPRDLAELGDMWSGCSQVLQGMPEERTARLVLFTPNVQPWCDMTVWNHVWAAFSDAGIGLNEDEIEMSIIGCCCGGW